MNFKRFFLLIENQVPYLLTILLGILSYQFNVLVDIVNKTPTIEYSINNLNQEHNTKFDIDTVLVEFTNLSSLHSYDSISFQFRLKSTEIIDTLYGIKFLEKAPFSGSLLKYEITGNNDWNLDIPHMQPSAIFVAIFIVKTLNGGFEEPSIFFTTQKDDVKISKKNIITWLVKKQVEVNLFLVFIWIAIIIIFIYFIILLPQNQEVNSKVDSAVDVKIEPQIYELPIQENTTEDVRESEKSKESNETKQSKDENPDQN